MTDSAHTYKETNLVTPLASDVLTTPNPDEVVHTPNLTSVYDSAPTSTEPSSSQKHTPLTCSTPTSPSPILSSTHDPLPANSPLYPFSNSTAEPTPPPITQPVHIHDAPISLAKLLTNPLLLGTKLATPEIIKLMSKARPCPCHLSAVPFATAGRSAQQANRDLRKCLAHDLNNGHDRAAFSSHPPTPDIPRADELEKLMLSFPGLPDLDYDNPPPAIASDLDIPEWRRLHARHCSNTTRCTSTTTADSCYAKPLIFMLERGFQAALDPNYSPSNIKPHAPAYVHLWQRDKRRCDAAFEKLLNSTDIRPVDDPSLIFPLLPAYRGKHLWRFRKFGTDYLPRITSDITTSGGNSIFLPWHLHYLGLLAVAAVVSRGDFLATRDLTGFYNRLPAGILLRAFQCFQDPRTYAASNTENFEKIKSGEAAFLQQHSCMFGHRQLPAWASCVSSELARILHKECAPVIGTIIDDLLFHGPAKDGAAALQARLDKADNLMAKLGLPTNDKGQAPSTRVVFGGIVIDTVEGVLDVDEEQRKYVIQRLEDVLGGQHCEVKVLESINGSLGWLGTVIHHGRCRRDAVQEACNSTQRSTPISRPLRKQLNWWLDILQRKAYRPSPIWFRNEVQKSLLIQSDASGDHGFGFCSAGFHVTGSWRSGLASVIENDMFVKELLPVTIATLLLCPHISDYILGSALDNSGVTSRVNCGSCRSPLGRRLLTAIADALWHSRSHMIADWNNREQPLAAHADTLSKILTCNQWKRLASSTQPPWIFDLVIQGQDPQQTYVTSIRIPRLSEAIPAHLRHRNRRQTS